MPEPVIAIRQDDAGFVVAVEPPDPAHSAQHFSDKRAAFGFAGGLKMVTGWRKVDLTEG